LGVKLCNLCNTIQNMRMRIKNLKCYSLIIAFGALLFGGCGNEPKSDLIKPNILILMSDNHSWNHLGCYGDPVIKTPNIDKLSEQGIRFTNAYCSAPSCSPARASMLTGQDIWMLEEAANLWGIFPAKFQVYTEMLEEAGYQVGYEGKGWGPGDYEAGGRTRNPAGTRYNTFEEFYNEVEKGQPFCYWYSSRDPHRPYKDGGWENEGIPVDDIVVPPYLPDNDDVRKDIGDYYSEIQNFDRDVASYIQLVKEMGQLENTLVIVCSDNGWQMPRGLANLYDFGTRIPLIISMPERYKGGRVIDDFISLNDFAPTFLELAGIPVPEVMNARSFVNILESEKDGRVDMQRDFIVTARERHAYVRQGGTGYGARSIRTQDFLYIRNYDPDVWPAGEPPLFGDVDAHMLHYPCATKMYMLKNKEHDGTKDLFNLAFAKRPAEELYDLTSDPDQMINVADMASYTENKEELSKKLTTYLKEYGDPREVGGEMKWIGAAYFAEKDKNPRPSEEAQRELQLNEEYSYENN
jgi:N-sulfoglucosamine sulfohydrolase